MRNGMSNSKRKFRSVSASITSDVYARAICGVVQRRWGGMRFAEKIMSRELQITQRTARNYLSGQHGPRGAELIRLMAVCDELRDEVLRLVEEEKARD